MLHRLLRGPAGRFLGRGLMVLRYTGTGTGRPRELVVQYARDGDTVWVMVGQAERTTWWHNLRRPAVVDLWLAGEHQRARAAAGHAAYRLAVPRAVADPGG